MYGVKFSLCVLMIGDAQVRWSQIHMATAAVTTKASWASRMWGAQEPCHFWPESITKNIKSEAVQEASLQLPQVTMSLHQDRFFSRQNLWTQLIGTKRMFEMRRFWTICRPLRPSHPWPVSACDEIRSCCRFSELFVAQAPWSSGWSWDGRSFARVLVCPRIWSKSGGRCWKRVAWQWNMKQP